MQIKIGKDNDLYITNVIVKASFASFVSTTALQPLDYMKTQKQQPPRNVSPILSERTKLSFRMLNQPLTLWRGLSPSLVRNVCGSSMYFCLLETAKTVNFLADMDENHLFLKNLVIGSICRTVSSISLFPFTFMKTRMESSYYSYSSLTNGLYSVVKNEGIISNILGHILSSTYYESNQYKFTTNIGKISMRAYSSYNGLFYNSTGRNCKNILPSTTNF
ncbi:hypothetical protein GJ496_007453 [Pomphorhynchus laevis]|nr:hypothetical protein GJ496_007453 [Pomphorhynchus laevis]